MAIEIVEDKNPPSISMLRQVATLEPLDGQNEPESELTQQSFSGRAAQFLLRHFLKLVVVALPTAIVIAIWGFTLSDRYISESRFVVRRVESQANPLSSALNIAAIGAPSMDDAYVVAAFIDSYDAVETLNVHGDLVRFLGRPEADVFSRYPGLWKPTRENLLQRYENFVNIDLDRTTQIATLTVEGFRPEDARDLNEAILQNAESLVNRLNGRARANAVESAKVRFAEAKDRVTQAFQRVTAFRTKEKIIDPIGEFKSEIEVIARLELEKAQHEAQIRDIKKHSPVSPVIAVEELRINSLNAEIEKQRSTLTGSDSSLAPLFAQYEGLTLDRGIAERALAAAAAELDAAEQDRVKQKLYLERVSLPHLPDKATLPHRWAAIAGTLVLCLFIYQIILRLLENVLEHANRNE